MPEHIESKKKTYRLTNTQTDRQTDRQTGETYFFLTQTITLISSFFFEELTESRKGLTASKHRQEYLIRMQISFTRADHHHLEREGKKSLISIKTFVQTQNTHKTFLVVAS